MSINTFTKKYPHPTESGDEEKSKKIPSVYPSSEKKSRVHDPNAFYPFKPLDDPQRTELVNTACKVPYWWQLLLCRDKLPASGKNYYTDLMERRDAIDYLAEGKRCIRKEHRGSAVVTEMIEDYGWEHPELQRYLYREYYSGIGLITGNSSDGLLAIDVDGASAQPLLELILGGEPPKTVSWTSGKPGRYQILFQVPRSHWERFENWVTCIPKSYAELPKAFRDKYPVSPEQDLIGPDKGELLEFRYNGRYSVLPPSRHPTTGMYKWIHSALDTKVAPLPERLLDLITAWTDLEAIEAEKKEQRQLEFAQKKAEREAKKAEREKSGVIVSHDSDCDEFEDILEAAQELNIRAGIDGFDWHGHDFTDHGGGWLQGNCPRHESSSGTSFQVEIDGDHAWRCHGCEVGSVGLANYLIWRETGEIKWSGNFSILKPYFTEYGIKLKNNFKKKDATTKTSEFSERLKQHFEARNLLNSGYPCYSESAPYCSENFLANIPHSGVVGIQAAMGVGKSTALKQWLTTTDTPKIFIYNRIALGYSQAISLSGSTPQEKINWIDDVQVSDFLQGRIKRIGLCYDSLHKLGTFNTNQPFHLILDECESGLIHLLTGETHRLNRAENISSLCRLLSQTSVNNGGCILSDATLRKSTIKYIAQFMPESPIKVLINTTKPKRRNVVLTGKEKASFFETTVAQLAKSDTPALIASDSKENLQALESLVLESLFRQGKTPKRVVRLDSDTSRTDEARSVMNNLNQTILTKNPDLFMFSPTLANGLSIDIEYFRKAYGLFFAINTPIESIQQMARDRHLTDWNIYATKGKYHGAVTVEAVIADKKRQESNLTEISDQLIKEVLRQHTANFTDSTATDNPDYINGKALIGLLEKFLEGGDYPTLSPKHSWYYYELVANQNWARANYYDVMVAELRAAGHDITFADGVKNSYSEVIKETIELTRLESCAKVAAVEAIFTDYATAHSAEQMAYDPEIQRQGTKSKILISTGILEPECTDTMVYHWKYNYREVVHANLLWFLYRNPHLTPTLDVSKLKRYAKNYQEGLEFCLQDVKLLGYKVHALTKYFKIQELESILDLEDPELTFSSSTPGLKDWALRVNKVSARIKDELGTEFNDNFPKIIAGVHDVRAAKLATWVLEKLGYSFTSQKVGKQYTYRYSSEFLSDVTRQNLLAGYDRKYNQTPDVIAESNDDIMDEKPVISTTQMALDTLIAPTTGRTLETILKGLNNYETLTPKQVFDDFQEVISLHEILPLNDLGNPNTLEYYCNACDPNLTEIQLEDMVRVTLAVLRIRGTYASGEEYTPEFKAVATPHLYVQNLLANYQRNEDDALLTDGKLAFRLLRQDVAEKGLKHVKE